jgi:hypothetical protein
MSRLTSRFRKLRTVGGVAGFTVTAIVVATIPGVALTNASWNDSEWTNAVVGTENCPAATNFTTRGGGRLISGTLGGVNLDSILALQGVKVTDGAGAVSVAPLGVPTLGSDAYANPLDVSVGGLSGINASLGSLLQLPLGASVGVVNQYGQALPGGSSAGASGLVDNSGAIALRATAPSASVPTFATLDLESVLSQLGLGGVASNLADLKLSLGAVSSSAQINGCNALWTKSLYSNLQRNYAIAGLTTELDSPLVGNLVSAVNATTTTLSSTVNALSGNTGLINGVLGDVTGALRTLIPTAVIGTPTATLNATVNFGALTTLLNTPITDPGNIVRIDLAHGTITVNTAALFDNVNGLNNQAPNTQLLLKAAVINSLVSAITTAVNAYVSSVTAVIDAALNAINVSLDIAVPVPPLGAGGGITLKADNVSLASLVAGSASLALGINCTLTVGCAALTTAAAALLNPVLGAVGSAVEVPLGTGISALVDPLATALTTTLSTTAGGIVTLLSASLNSLFGPNALLSIVLNAQNAPDPAVAVAGNPLPSWALTVTAPTAAPYSTGQYDVSAVEVQLLSGGITLDLARSSVGSNVKTQ